MLRFDPFDGAELTALTASDFQALVSSKVVEGLWVEYKSQWNPAKVARAVASFANSEGGGTVVVGIAAEGLEPVAAEGFAFDGEVEAAVVNAVRSNVDPVPTLEVGATPALDGKVHVAVRVPAGSDPPYVMKDGTILIRTPTSSEPVRVNDRESVDRLFQRGRRGEEWAVDQRDQRVGSTQAMSSFPHWVKFWSIPCVEGGLDVGGRIFREPFIDAVANLDITGWGRPSQRLDPQTLPSSLVIRQVLGNDVTLTIGQDGVIETAFQRGKPADGARRELPTYEEVRNNLTVTCRAHRAVLEKLGYGGRIVFALSGGLVAIGKPYIVQHTPKPLPVNLLTYPAHVGATERAIRRFFSNAVPDP